MENSNKKINPFDLMTVRQREIMLALSEGAQVKQLADKLKISVSTIYNTKFRIIKKYNYKSNSELLFDALTYKPKSKAS